MEKNYVMGIEIEFKFIIHFSRSHTEYSFLREIILNHVHLHIAHLVNILCLLRAILPLSPVALEERWV